MTTNPFSEPPTAKRFSRPAMLLALALLVAGGAAAVHLLSNPTIDNHARAATPERTLENIPFNGTQAYEYLKQLCAIGPRPSGSPGMEKQQQLLAEHFQKLGGQVEFQRFRVRHPQNGSPVPMANILIRWHPEKNERILLCAHYDTLPYPMLDRVDPRGTFVGANDNAGGVALLMELARDLAAMPIPYGVDILLLDGEEFRFTSRDRLFLGSEYFAREYAKDKPPYHYRWGVLLDMIADADLQIFQERNSVWWQDTRPLVEQIWSTAARLGVTEFVPKPKHDVEDDHVMLHNLGGIPCIDVIDFDYPAWHTQDDTPKRCSPLSLAKVGWVLREWLKTQQ